MTPEWTMLVSSCIFGLLQLFVTAGAATKQRGFQWNVGPRDGTPQPLTGVAGRMDRAFRNFMETFPFFLAAIFFAHFTGRTNSQTALGAELYLGARILYFPIYALGITYLRTALWGLSIIGITMVLLCG